MYVSPTIFVSSCPSWVHAAYPLFMLEHALLCTSSMVLVIAFVKASSTVAVLSYKPGIISVWGVLATASRVRASLWDAPKSVFCTEELLSKTCQQHELLIWAHWGQIRAKFFRWPVCYQSFVIWHCFPGNSCSFGFTDLISTANYA